MKIKRRNSTNVLSRATRFIGAWMRAGPTAALHLFLLIEGYIKVDTAVGSTPIVIPLQIIMQASVNLRSTVGFVVLTDLLISKILISPILMAEHKRTFYSFSQTTWRVL
jgi:hypothetical protein